MFKKLPYFMVVFLVSVTVLVLFRGNQAGPYGRGNHPLMNAMLRARFHGRDPNYGNSTESNSDAAPAADQAPTQDASSVPSDWLIYASTDPGTRQRFFHAKRSSEGAQQATLDIVKPDADNVPVDAYRIQILLGAGAPCPAAWTAQAQFDSAPAVTFSATGAQSDGSCQLTLADAGRFVGALSHSQNLHATLAAAGASPVLAQYRTAGFAME